MNQTIRTLIEYLNARTKEYDNGCPTISDVEWDNKYFELQRLETLNGIYYDDSPTQSISYEVVSSLEKVIHNHDMLSLEKTKSLNEVEDFLGTVPYLAMCKMDGLTCSLKYVDGILVSAETRGNGQVGENILHNAKVIPSIPNKIPYKEEIIIDGEIICSKHDFVKFENEYKNPRNFASGSIRLLDSNECSKRKLQFIAWDVINGFNHLENLSEKLILLKGMGFIIAPFCDSKEIDADGEALNYITAKIVDKDGILCPNASNRLIFKAEGGVETYATDAGDQRETETFLRADKKALAGMLVCCVRSNGRNGEALVSCYGDGLISNSITFDCK